MSFFFFFKLKLALGFCFFVLFVCVSWNLVVDLNQLDFSPLYLNPPLMAQLDAHATESGGRGFDNSLPFADSRRVVVGFCQKNVHKYWLTA